MFASDYPECREYVDPREAAAAQEANRVSMCVAGYFRELASQAAGHPVSRELVVQIWTILHGFISLYHSGIFEHMVDSVDELREAVLRQAVGFILTPRA
jgi:hypothetical protein